MKKYILALSVLEVCSLTCMDSGSGRNAISSYFVLEKEQTLRQFAAQRDKDREAVAALTSLQKTCVTCNYTAKDARQYRPHSRNATHQALTKTATTDQERRIQAAWNRELKKFTCSCGALFSDMGRFKAHHCILQKKFANFITPEQHLTCATCNHSDRLPASFQRHLESAHHEALTKIASTDQEHRVQAAWNREQKKFICSCGNVFSRIDFFQGHDCIQNSFLDSEQGFVCTTCNYKTTETDLFIKHRKNAIHLALTKTATTDQERRVQAAWNRAQRKFICICDKYFYRLSDFENHECMLTDNFSNLEKELNCAPCNYKVADGWHWARHLNSAQHQALTKTAITDQERWIQAAWNKDSKTFICYCDKGFHDITLLKRHRCNKNPFLVHDADKNNQDLDQEVVDKQDISLPGEDDLDEWLDRVETSRVKKMLETRFNAVSSD